MRVDFAAICAENRSRYGTRIDRYGPILLAGLYSQRTHFLYELLQNAEDAGAKSVRFRLFRDRLEFLHDGRAFNEADVRSICGLVESTKSLDMTQIGRFGIGFKSVFAFTVCPQVHSGGVQFCIRDFVHPHPIDPLSPAIRPRGHVLFVLPFDHPQVPADVAFKEIREAIQSLGGRVLLFLRSIRSLGIEVQSRDAGGHSRTTRTDRSFCRVYLESRDPSSRVSSNERWLLCSRTVEPDSSYWLSGTAIAPLPVQAAWLMDDHGRIVPSDELPLFVYFPTQKRSGLRLAIQGPYRTTPARDNIQEDDPWNRKLLDATADLIGEALVQLRERKLLTVNVLETLSLGLPCEVDFRPILVRVCEVLRREPLIPLDNHIFVEAGRAVLGRGSAIRSLLSEEQLGTFLRSTVSVGWASREFGQDRLSHLYRFLRDEVGVREVTPESFARELTTSFLRLQPVDWFVRLYDFLGSHPALLKRPFSRRGERESLLHRPLIVTSDGRLVPPLQPDGQPNVYLPPRDGATSFKIVHPLLASKCRSFLAGLGLKEPDLAEEVMTRLLPRYSSPQEEISRRSHRRHLRTIEDALRTSTRDRKDALLRLLAETPVLRALEWDRGRIRRSEFRKPCEIYLRSAELEMYFQNSRSVWFLDPSYPQLVDFQEQLGVAGSVRVSRQKADRSTGVVTLKTKWGAHSRGLDGFDPEAWVDRLEEALTGPTLERAKYVWTKLLSPNASLISGVVEKSSRRGFPADSTERAEKTSRLGAVVQRKHWLPKADGTFHPPRDLSLEDLPDGFAHDDTLARQLKMKHSGLLKLARDRGVDPRVLEYALLHPDRILELARKEVPSESDAAPRQSVSGVPTIVPNQHQRGKSLDRPDGYQGQDDSGGPSSFADEISRLFGRLSSGEATPSQTIEGAGGSRNPDARRAKARQMVENAIDAEPSPEDRFKRVPQNVWEPRDGSVRAALYEWYGGRCQICGFTFYKRSGRPYFETLQLVSRVHGRWLDHPGNSLCLCANCCARMQYGEVAGPGLATYVLQIKAVPGQRLEHRVPVVLCGEQAEIRYCDAHLIEFQVLLDLDASAIGSATRTSSRSARKLR